jgi:hypothetical protein
MRHQHLAKQLLLAHCCMLLCKVSAEPSHAAAHLPAAQVHAVHTPDSLLSIPLIIKLYETQAPGLPEKQKMYSAVR